MDKPEASHRTRSKAAPGWTVQESLVLVNEISAVEVEWGANLPSFQKWRQIVQNCNSLDVNRTLNQCKRQWEALMRNYRRYKNDDVEDFLFPVELFAAIDRCVSASAKKSGGGAEEEVGDEEEEEEDGKEEKQVVMETNPEAQGRATRFFFETGSKKRKRRTKRQNQRLETRNPWGYLTSAKIKHEETSSMDQGDHAENANTIVESVPEEISETKDQCMAKILQKNALQIHAILEGKLADDQSGQTDFTRRQGDCLIDCLGKISVTLTQLCDLVQQCN